MADLEEEFFAEGTPRLVIEKFGGLFGVFEPDREEWLNDQLWFCREDAQAELIRILARHE